MIPFNPLRSESTLLNRIQDLIRLAFAVCVSEAELAAAIAAIPSSSSSDGVADWSLTGTRWYAVDDTNGKDTNRGYSDSSSADAGTKALKTLARLAEIVPRTGAARKLVIVVRARASNAQYADGLGFLVGLSGYKATTVVATDTNATAGAVAFAGDAADQIFLGARTATGMNAAGYHPTGVPTTTSVPCLTAAGADPAFPAEPAIPLGTRMRFSSSTTTAALRNICRSVVSVSEGGGVGTVVPHAALPAVPAAGDTFYLEMPGVLVNVEGGTGIPGNLGPVASTGSSSKLQIAGFDFSAATSSPYGLSGVNFAFCRWQGNALFAQSDAFVNVAYTYNDDVAAIRTVGSSTFEGLVTSRTGAATFDAACVRPTGTSAGCQIISPLSADAQLGCVFAKGFLLADRGNSPSGVGADVFVGSRTSGAAPVRIVSPFTTTSQGASACGLALVGWRGTLGHIDITGMGANPAVRLVGMCDITIPGDSSNIAGLTGATGNTDVGLDLTQAFGSRIQIPVNCCTVTGTLGDVRLSDGTIVTWAVARAGVIDTAGNVLWGAAGTSPQHFTAVAAGAVVVAWNNAPAGSPAAPARYVKIPDGAGGFYTFGSLT